MEGDPPVGDWEVLEAYVEAARLLTGEEPPAVIVRRLARLTSRQRGLIVQAITEIAEEESRDPP
jgi:hypothetical protein